MSTHVTHIPAPLQNTPLFPHVKTEKDHQGLYKTVESIALPFTQFTLVQQIEPTISQVTTLEYPSTDPLYIDSRFLIPTTDKTPKEKVLPPTSAIIKSFQSMVGARYFWGGNWFSGIPQMANFYPSIEPTDDLFCKGVDCSGLLYQATQGFTPRNTSQLCHYGKELLFDPQDPTSLQKIVKPLDMMVWKGHVIFVLDSQHFIESTLGHGVIITPFIERYIYYREKLLQENKTFYFRRWYPEL